jgi:hypothetical protein
MPARLGDVIYSLGCIVASGVLALGVFDYWLGKGGFIVLVSWAIASAIRYILSGR